jgi:hypothetical protein
LLFEIELARVADNGTAAQRDAQFTLMFGAATSICRVDAMSENQIVVEPQLLMI